jgi:hypothetical protein
VAYTYHQLVHVLGQVLSDVSHVVSVCEYQRHGEEHVEDGGHEQRHIGYLLNGAEYKGQHGSESSEERDTEQDTEIQSKIHRERV